MSDILEIHQLGIDVDNRIIYFHSEAEHDGQEQGIDFRCFSQFVKNLNFLSLTKDKIRVIMNSIGGDLAYSLSAYDLVKAKVNNGIELECSVVGYSCSGGSILLQAFPTRTMTENSCLLLHYGEASPLGDVGLLSSYLDFYKKQIDVMVEIYAKRMLNSKALKGKTLDEVKSFIRQKFSVDRDWYVNSEDAIAYGLVDSIVKY